MRLFSPFRHPTLRTRLVALVAVVVALFEVFLFVWFPPRFEATARRNLIDRALGAATLLESALQAPLDFDDPTAAGKALAALAHKPDAVFAVAFRADGTVLAGWGAVPAGSFSHSGVPVESDEDQVRVRIPIHSDGPPGQLALGLRMNEVHEQQAEALRTIGLAALVVAVLGMAAAFIIGTIFTRPIQKITRFATVMSEGGTPEPLTPQLSRRDEVGEMATALNAMLSRVFSHQALVLKLNQELRHLNAELEQRVEDRTRQLQHANAELNEKLHQLKSTQDQLIVADRRVAVGQLAAGVAHEVNNPLAYILGNVTFAVDELRAMPLVDDDARESVDEVISALTETKQGAERVRYIVQSLKTLSRGDDDSRESVDLNDCVESSLSMAANQIKHRARLVKSLDRVPDVDANEVRLGQVFLNLLLNAAQAIDGARASGNEISVRSYTNERGWAVVEVRDTGCGMSDEVKKQLFRPFFTTKPVGVGTGLGLSVCAGIVQALGGEIEVESQVGVGSTFRVLLPPGASTDALPVPTIAVIPPGAGARVMVIDDEPMVASAVRRLIGRAHEVVPFTDAQIALERLETDGRFDLIICDLMMPGTTGMQFAERVQRRHPSLSARLRFMTGGAFTPDATAFFEANRSRILDKPIDQQALLAAVKDALELKVEAHS